MRCIGLQPNEQLPNENSPNSPIIENIAHDLVVLVLDILVQRTGCQLQTRESDGPPLLSDPLRHVGEGPG